ncbi:MAG: hypothetical protein M3O23_10995 [Actinomycetota bacterium]|nr:hypothetical protein [Actinomycetota bacterium]
MRKHPRWSPVVALSLAAVLALAGATPAVGHEEAAVGGFRLAVGWGDEPAYTGVMNGVQVTISEADSGAPVTDVGDSLKVEVIKGSDRITLPLDANFGGGSGTPGDYRARLTPTRPGTYTFRFFGTIRGQAVDQSFTSSQTTFDEVEDAASVQFPAKDPSTGQLATRVDRESSRLDTRTDAVEERADGARTLAMVGVGVGALGLLTAAGALVAARRGSAGGGGPKPERQARAEQAASLTR